MAMLSTWGMSIFSGCLILLVLLFVARKKLHARYASWWIVFIVITSCSVAAGKGGSQLMTSNGASLLMVFAPFVLVVVRAFFADVTLSQQKVAHRRLAQSYALLEERVQQLEGNTGVHHAECKGAAEDCDTVK
jgi:hypothetical protein